MNSNPRSRGALTPIIGYAQMLLGGDLSPEEAREAAEAILRAGGRLQSLFERMATLIRLKRETSPELEEVSVGTLLDLVREMDPALLGEVEYRGDLDLRVRCHPPILAQMLYELLENGRRFGEPPVSLTWSEGEETGELRVTDRGPGPAPRLLSEDLFPPRHQPDGDYVMPREMGLRLGLAHARALTRLSGASLRFDQAEGGWALVLVLHRAREGWKAG